MSDRAETAYPSRDEALRPDLQPGQLDSTRHNHDTVSALRRIATLPYQ